MKVCKNCGELNTNDSLFCCNCGQSNFILQDEVTCTSCGAVNDKSFVHCINCGNKLGEGHSHQVQQDEGYRPVPVDVRLEHSGVYDLGLSSIPSEMAHCPHCGAVIPITAIFCPKCGISVANLHVGRIVERKVCPHCGKLNKLDANTCSYCFSGLAHADTEQLRVVHDAQNLGDLTVRQAYLEGLNGKQLICPNCSSLNEPKEVFCVNCGLRLEPEAAKKYCPNCGTENLADSAFCAKCRWSFEGEAPGKKEKWNCHFCNNLNDQDDKYCPNCGRERQK